CLFQFNKQLNVDSPQEMLAAISTYSDIPLDERPLKLEYFVNMDYHFEHFILDLEGGYGWAVLSVRFILSVVFFSPLIIFLAVFWRKCVRSEQSKLGKWVYRLAALSPLAALPAFVLTVDYGRWICAIFFMQFTMLLYSLYIQDNNAKAVLAEIYEFVVPKRVAAYFVVLLYFMSIGQIYAVAILRDISIIGKIGKKVLEILF
ncbi:MAG: hypothetical protein LBS35_12775, partial [Synergistaceae bacterium]|nr:hypothetical protein [Synergistaceae bacterium]